LPPEPNEPPEPSPIPLDAPPDEPHPKKRRSTEFRSREIASASCRQCLYSLRRTEASPQPWQPFTQ
jgi:hypothetical protein